MNWLGKLLGRQEQIPEDAPDFWRAYAQTFAYKPSAQKAISEVRFVVFDTETTGLDPCTDRIISMAGVEVLGQTIHISRSFEWFLETSENCRQAESITVHGILPQQTTSEGIPEQQAMTQFLAFVQDAVLVAHHAAFDITIVNEALRRYCPGKPKLLNKSLDTAHLAIRLEQYGSTSPYKSSDYSLDSLIDRYQLRAHDRHNAAGDSFITAQLLIKLLSKARQRGIRTLGDLLKTKSR